MCFWSPNAMPRNWMRDVFPTPFSPTIIRSHVILPVFVNPYNSVTITVRWDVLLVPECYAKKLDEGCFPNSVFSNYHVVFSIKLMLKVLKNLEFFDAYFL